MIRGAAVAESFNSYCLCILTDAYMTHVTFEDCTPESAKAIYDMASTNAVGILEKICESVQGNRWNGAFASISDVELIFAAVIRRAYEIIESPEP